MAVSEKHTGVYVSRSKEQKAEPEGQPNGIRIEKTLDVVNEILTNPEVCEETKTKYGWPVDMSSDRCALLFLAMRYQDAMSILSLRTETLKREVDGFTTRLVNLEDNVYEYED